MKATLREPKSLKVAFTDLRWDAFKQLPVWHSSGLGRVVARSVGVDRELGRAAVDITVADVVVAVAEDTLSIGAGGALR